MAFGAMFIFAFQILNMLVTNLVSLELVWKVQSQLNRDLQFPYWEMNWPLGHMMLQETP